MPPSSIRSLAAYWATLPKPWIAARTPFIGMPIRLQRLAHGVDHAETGRLGAAQGAADLDRLAGDQPGVVAAGELLVLVEHPHHVLGVGHHVRRGHVLERADVRRHLAHPAAAQQLLLPLARGCAGRRSRRPCRRRGGCRPPRTSRSSTWPAHAPCRRFPGGGSGCRPWPGRGRRCAAPGSRGRPAPSRRPSAPGPGSGTRAAATAAARGCRRPAAASRPRRRTGAAPSRTR